MSSLDCRSFSSNLVSSCKLSRSFFSSYCMVLSSFMYCWELFLKLANSISASW